MCCYDTAEASLATTTRETRVGMHEPHRTTAVVELGDSGGSTGGGAGGVGGFGLGFGLGGGGSRCGSPGNSRPAIVANASGALQNRMGSSTGRGMDVLAITGMAMRAFLCPRREHTVRKSKLGSRDTPECLRFRRGFGVCASRRDCNMLW